MAAKPWSELQQTGNIREYKEVLGLLMADNNKRNAADDIVTEEKPVSEWKLMFKTEDWWAVWLGLILLVVGVLIFFPNPPADLGAKIAENQAIMQVEEERAPFRTMAYLNAERALSGLRARDEEPGKTIGAYLGTTARWKDSPVEAFYRSDEEAARRAEAAQPRWETAQANLEAAKAKAEEAEALAAAAGFQDRQLNEQAQAAIAGWQKERAAESSARKAATTEKGYNYIPGWLVLGLGMMIFWGLGARVMGQSFGKLLVAFPAIFIMTIIAFIIGNHETIRALGFSYVLWAIFLGLIIANTVGTPRWLKPALMTEFYIKTGLVLLGASILVGKIALIGIPGIFVAWVVTPIVLIATFWFGQTVLKVPSKELNITVSADMSVSGVSAAIAAAAACRAKREELTLAVGISMVFTSIMIFAMPAMIHALGMPGWKEGAGEVVAGAWIGGTVDNTGAVVAAGELVGPVAMYTAATIKMIQNITIGVMAFCIAAYWALKVERERTGVAGKVDLSFKTAMAEIWRRFPKFILGFVAASVVFSVIFGVKGAPWGEAMVEQGVLAGWANGLREWFFGLAFISIGLSTNFRELWVYLKGGKPVILYVLGQSFNILLTVAMAYIMFMWLFYPLTQRVLAM